MTKFAAVSLLILSITLMVSAPTLAGQSKEDKEKEKQAKAEKGRQEIRKRAQDILARLYKAQPSAKAAIGKAAGYATFSNFGWELSGQTSAAAKAGEKGASLQGALAIAPGVWLYQLTDAGLALELTAKGTKYSKDDDLN